MIWQQEEFQKEMLQREISQERQIAYGNSGNTIKLFSLSQTQQAILGGGGAADKSCLSGIVLSVNCLSADCLSGNSPIANITNLCLGYCLCPGTVVLGPWLPFQEYQNIFIKPRNRQFDNPFLTSVHGRHPSPTRGGVQVSFNNPVIIPTCCDLDDPNLTMLN